MKTRDWAYIMIDELTDEEFNALMAVVKIMYKNSQEKNQGVSRKNRTHYLQSQYPNSLRGIVSNIYPDSGQNTP